MPAENAKKVFTELALYLWRIRHSSETKWRSEIFFRGPDNTLIAMRKSLQSMTEEYSTHGQSTRKFLCNPPDDFDVVRFADEHHVEIEWQIWLILHLQRGITDDRTYDLKNKVVTVWLNPRTLEQFLQILDQQLNQPDQYLQGQKVPGGLFLAMDWLGAKQGA